MVPEPKPVTEIPYEKAAMRLEEMPDGLDYPDQFLFLELRNLYGQLKLGIINRQKGTLEKKKLLDTYRQYKFAWEIGEEWVEQIKKTELARAEYRKDRTLENADKLLAAIEGRKL